MVAAMIWALGDQRNIKNVHKVVQEFTTFPQTSNVTTECQNGRRRIIAETSPPSVQLSEMADTLGSYDRAHSKDWYLNLRYFERG